MFRGIRTEPCRNISTFPPGKNRMIVDAFLFGSRPPSSTISGRYVCDEKISTTSLAERHGSAPERFAEVDVTGNPKPRANARTTEEDEIRIATSPFNEIPLAKTISGRNGKTTVKAPGQTVFKKRLIEAETVATFPTCAIDEATNKIGFPFSLRFIRKS
jgi:hypothetical protein